ncbi:uncharacterized protein LOC118431230 isoform X2 [Branchiostoma floridae]|uniref:Uncharacterized protein LOC118431230 isoform X2 n=1 Tax=Branchiostoma floridae TaxID=7739 RepID=A0A9J7NBF9_BRAFL|nr:uncharacterized protein LOC118431230 isoform X2 [Branchiostoma floridae]
MPLRGPGFNQPVTTAVLSVAAVATMLWLLFSEEGEEKKSEKKTHRPREPRTIMLPKLSFRDFRNDVFLYGEDGEYEVIVLEEWVDKYDGPSSAYSRRSFPTESRSWPTVAQSYRPAAPQPRPRQPDRRPPGKFGLGAIGSTYSIFGDEGLFSDITGMGDFHREKPAADTIVHRVESAEFLRRVRAAKIKIEAGDISRHSAEKDEDDASGPSWREVKEEEFLKRAARDVVDANSRHSEETDEEYCDAPGLPLLKIKEDEFLKRAELNEISTNSRHSEEGSVYIDVPGLPPWMVEYDEFYNPNPPMWLAEDMEVEDLFFDALDVPLRALPQSAVKAQQLGPVQELERPHQLLMALIMFVMTEFFASFRILMSSVTESLGGAMQSVFAVLQPHYDKIKQLILPFIPSVVKDSILSISGCTWMLMTSVAESTGGAMNRALALLWIHSDKFQLVANKIKQLLQPLVPYVMMFKDSMVSMVGSARMMVASAAESVRGTVNRALELLWSHSDKFQLVADKIKQLLQPLVPYVMMFKDSMVSMVGSARMVMANVAASTGDAVNGAFSSFQYDRFQAVANNIKHLLLRFIPPVIQECMVSFYGSIRILMTRLPESIGGALTRALLALHYAIFDLLYTSLKQLLLAFIPYVVKFKEYIISIYGYVRILMIKLVVTVGGAVKRALLVLHYVGFDLMYTNVKRLLMAFLASVLRFMECIVSYIIYTLILIYLMRLSYTARKRQPNRRTLHSL